MQSKLNLFLYNKWVQQKTKSTNPILNYLTILKQASKGGKKSIISQYHPGSWKKLG